MKNALILHGTADSPKANWFPWLKEELEKEDYEVWTPQLPNAEKPNTKRYNEFLLKNKEWFNSNSILIGHSSGAVAILGLLQDLPDNIQVDTCYLVAAFKDDLGWEALNELFEAPFDFEKIKKRAKKIIFIHSDNDPYCPLEHAQYLSSKTGGELIIRGGQKHFSISNGGEMYSQFPFLLNLITSKDEN